jgi:transcriptional regulator with XRE-family HTH domain
MSVAQIRKEVAHSTVRDARELLGLTDSEIGTVIGASRRTVQRWWKQEGVPAPEHQRLMERVREAVFLSRQVFRDAAATQRWFHSPSERLRGRTPASVVQEGRIDEVIGVLAGMASGSHA